MTNEKTISLGVLSWEFFVNLLPQTTPLVKSTTKPYRYSQPAWETVEARDLCVWLDEDSRELTQKLDKLNRILTKIKEVGGCRPSFISRTDTNSPEIHWTENRPFGSITIVLDSGTGMVRVTVSNNKVVRHGAGLLPIEEP